MPTPTIRWNVDADGDWGTAANWDPGRIPGATDDVVINTEDIHSVTHAAGTDEVMSLTVGNDFFDLVGGSLSIDGTSTFGNGLRILGANLTLGGDATAASFQQGYSRGPGVLSGAGNLTVNGAAFFADDLLQTGAGATVLKGSTACGASTFCLDGGRVLENQGVFTITRKNSHLYVGFNIFGVTLGGGALKNDVGATIDVRKAQYVGGDADGSFINAGTLEKTVGTGVTEIVGIVDAGSIVIAVGTLSFRDASFAGPVSGAGTLNFAGKTQSINSGTTITTANWSISDFATAFVNANLVYAGNFSQAYNSTLTIAAHDRLSLTGASTLTGMVNGAGVLRLSSATLSPIRRRFVGFVLGGAATLSIAGTADQMGTIVVGDAGSTGATLSIDQGATYRIEKRSDIITDNPAASRIRNDGLLIKLGDRGKSVIAVKTADDGAIEAADGTLDFTQAITGGGTLRVDAGATLELGSSAAATLDVIFNSGDAILALGAPAMFAATVDGFAPTDTIDLVRTAADAATLGAGDTLVITNGATTIATLQLAGDYSAATFNVASDGHGGSNITVTMPAVAPTARFAAAMAGLGADSHGPAPTWIQSRPDAWRPMLSTPRSGHFA